MELIAQIEARNVTDAEAVEIANECAFLNDYRGPELGKDASREDAYSLIRHVYEE